jgi:hypothetical protein
VYSVHRRLMPTVQYTLLSTYPPLPPSLLPPLLSLHQPVKGSRRITRRTPLSPPPLRTTRNTSSSPSRSRKLPRDLPACRASPVCSPGSLALGSLQVLG